MAEALNELIALKRRNPGDDLTTRLMQHSAQLSDEEMLHQLITLLSGGTTPLSAMIGSASALILGEEWQSGLPVEDAVTQVLWNYAPIANYAAHYPTHDVELGGRVVKANDPVLISFAAANTDPGSPSTANSSAPRHTWPSARARTPAPPRTRRS